MRPMKRMPNYEKLVAHVNRKDWWHVPPVDPDAYRRRGKFLASTFAEAEFWGRPLDEPQKVKVAHPLLGDEATIEKALFGRCVSREDIKMEERWALDARMKRAALASGYDSIVLMTPKAFTELKARGRLPRSLELNILNVSVDGDSQLTETGNRPQPGHIYKADCIRKMAAWPAAVPPLAPIGMPAEART